MSKVYRDASGKVINIGEWDYLIESVIDENTGKLVQIQHNPLPEGHTISEEETVVGWDGGIYVLDDPRSIR